MKVKTVSESENTLILEFKNVDNALVNAIRRICIAEVETYAIDTVDFIVNDGALNNEYVAHRLGLCVLKVTGKLENNNKISTDFICENNKEYVYLRDFDFPENVEPVYPDTKITILTKGQSFRITANISKGSGLTHAKWSPVCPAFFKKIENDKYHLIIESTGSLTPRTIYTQALDTLEQKLHKVQFEIS